MCDMSNPLKEEEEEEEEEEDKEEEEEEEKEEEEAQSGEDRICKQTKDTTTRTVTACFFEYHSSKWMQMAQYKNVGSMYGNITKNANTSTQEDNDEAFLFLD